MGLFDGGAKDRAQVVEALQQLGPTDLESLSVSLKWAPHRTARALKGLSDGTRYDATSGEVTPPVRPARRSTPSPTEERAPVAPEPTLIGTCPECDHKLSGTGGPGTYYCPDCGYLETRPQRGSPPVTSAPALPGTLDPRKAQELIAAWVTAQPIPCPNCRQLLRHEGVESYACPACGERVTFSDSGVAAVPKATA